MSAVNPKRAVARGGGWSSGAFTCRSTNRTRVDAGFRDLGLGVRICATWPTRRGSELAAVRDKPDKSDKRDKRD